ncbi:hypothetical protein CK203_097633 [Vitis vinifera]|uniref:Uncharacterized protein n=1 Tax=Vitis vinifera TaxID=29760 RepID=A0A438D592_VITVI|nr:hypothetical protein CK203_097633 [Vitis vinifera]
MEEPNPAQTNPTPPPNAPQNLPPPPPQPPTSLPQKTKKRSLDSNVSIQNSKYFKTRAVVKDLRPHFIEVLRSPDFRNCKAANEIRELFILLKCQFFVETLKRVLYSSLYDFRLRFIHFGLLDDPRFKFDLADQFVQEPLQAWDLACPKAVNLILLLCEARVQKAIMSFTDHICPFNFQFAELKVLMDLYKQMTAETVSIGKCKNVPEAQPTLSENKDGQKPHERHQDVKQAEQSVPDCAFAKPSEDMPFPTANLSEKQRPEDGWAQGTYVVGGSAFGWNFITFPGSKPAYYGVTKETFRAAAK